MLIFYLFPLHKSHDFDFLNIFKNLDIRLRESIFMLEDELNLLPERETYCTIAPGVLNYKNLGTLAPFTRERSPEYLIQTTSLRSTKFDLKLLMHETINVRKTKLSATIRPPLVSTNALWKMMQAGLDVARIETTNQNLEEVKATIREIQKVYIVPYLCTWYFDMKKKKKKKKCQYRLLKRILCNN